MATKTPGPGVPSDYDPSQFPAFAVTVDVVILTMSEGRLHVLLVLRGEAPFEGMWAIPGGFKRPHETLDEAAKRELGEETGVDAASLLTQFGAYGDPGRDPRMNVVTVAYLAVLRDVGAIVAGTDAAHAGLVPASDIPRGEDRARVRPPANRPRRGRARPGRARGLGHRDGLHRHDLHDGRAPSGVRGDLGRAARCRELPPQPRGRRRLGDPDRPHRPTRAGRRQARRALPGRAGLEARHTHPSHSAEPREEVTE